MRSHISSRVQQVQLSISSYPSMRLLREPQNQSPGASSEAAWDPRSNISMQFTQTGPAGLSLQENVAFAALERNSKNLRFAQLSDENHKTGTGREAHAA
jgi:hypothetical protein